MPTWQGIDQHAAAGCLVKPLLLQILQDDEYPFEFDVHVQRSPWRGPDGWFHASIHPRMSERELWSYLAHPELIKPEALGYIGRMSTMFGTFTHAVLQEALRPSKVWVKVPIGMCQACGLKNPFECTEHGFSDPETLSRGHVDGILNFGKLGTHGWDLKTAKTLSLHGCPDMDLEFFIKKWPHYWTQMQEYMRLSGLRNWIVSFLGLGNPWTLLEYHIPFDPVHCAQVEAKYKRVIAAVKSGRDII